MKVIKLDKILIDGRFMRYHRPVELISTGNITIVKLGSWTDLETILAPPDAISDIPIGALDPSYIVEYIITLPGWEEGTILDYSKPYIPEVEWK